MFHWSITFNEKCTNTVWRCCISERGVCGVPTMPPCDKYYILKSKTIQVLVLVRSRRRTCSLFTFSPHRLWWLKVSVSMFSTSSSFGLHRSVVPLRCSEPSALLHLPLHLIDFLWGLGRWRTGSPRNFSTLASLLAPLYLLIVGRQASPDLVLFIRSPLSI